MASRTIAPIATSSASSMGMSSSSGVQPSSLSMAPPIGASSATGTASSSAAPYISLTEALAESINRFSEERAKGDSTAENKLKYLVSRITEMVRGQLSPVDLQKELVDNPAYYTPAIKMAAPTTENAHTLLSSMYGIRSEGLNRNVTPNAKNPSQMDTAYTYAAKPKLTQGLDAWSFSKDAGSRLRSGEIGLPQAIGDVVVGQAANLGEVFQRGANLLPQLAASTANPDGFSKPKVFAPIGTENAGAMWIHKNPEEHPVSQTIANYLDPGLVLAGASKLTQAMRALRLSGAGEQAMAKINQAANTFRRKGVVEKVAQESGRPAEELASSVEHTTLGIPVTAKEGKDILHATEIPPHGTTPTEMQILHSQGATGNADASLGKVTSLGGEARDRDPYHYKPTPLTSADQISAAIHNDNSKPIRSVAKNVLSRLGIISKEYALDPENPLFGAWSFQRFAQKPSAGIAGMGSATEAVAPTTIAGKAKSHAKMGFDFLRNKKPTAQSGKTPGVETASDFAKWTADRLSGHIKSGNFKSEVKFTNTKQRIIGKDHLDDTELIPTSKIGDIIAHSFQADAGEALTDAANRAGRVHGASPAVEADAEMRGAARAEKFNANLESKIGKREQSLQDMQEEFTFSDDKASALKPVEDRRATEVRTQGENQARGASLNIEAGQETIRVLRSKIPTLLENMRLKGLLENKGDWANRILDEAKNSEERGDIIRQLEERMQIEYAKKYPKGNAKMHTEMRKALNELNSIARSLVKTPAAVKHHANTEEAGLAKASGKSTPTLYANMRADLRKRRLDMAKGKIKRKEQELDLLYDSGLDVDKAAQEAKYRASHTRMKGLANTMAESLRTAMAADAPPGAAPLPNENIETLIKELKTILPSEGVSLNQLENLISKTRAAADKAGIHTNTGRKLEALRSELRGLYDAAAHEYIALRLEKKTGKVPTDAEVSSEFKLFDAARKERANAVDTRLTLADILFENKWGTADRSIPYSNLLQNIDREFANGMVQNAVGTSQSSTMVGHINSVINDMITDGYTISKDYLANAYKAANQFRGEVSRGKRMEGYTTDTRGTGAPIKISKSTSNDLVSGRTPITAGNALYAELPKSVALVKHAVIPFAQALKFSAGGADLATTTLAAAYHSIINPLGNTLYPSKISAIPPGLPALLSREWHEATARGITSAILHGRGRLEKSPGRLAAARLISNAMGTQTNENAYNQQHLRSDYTGKEVVSDETLRQALKMLPTKELEDIATELASDWAGGGLMSGLWNEAVMKLGKPEWQTTSERSLPQMERKDATGKPLTEKTGPLGAIEGAMEYLNPGDSDTSSVFLTQYYDATKPGMREVVAKMFGTLEGKKRDPGSPTTIGGVTKETRNSYAKEGVLPFKLPDDKFEKFMQTGDNASKVHVYVADKHLSERHQMSLDELTDSPMPMQFKKALARLAIRMSPADEDTLWSKAINGVFGEVMDDPEMPPDAKDYFMNTLMDNDGVDASEVPKLLETLGESSQETQDMAMLSIHDAFADWLSVHKEQGEARPQLKSFMKEIQ